MTPASPAPFRIVGWHVAVAVTVFFGVIVAVDAMFLVAAYKTFPGQVSVTPYEDGLAYNRDVARRRAQQALGWSATADVDGPAIIVELRDAEGHAVTGLAIQGDLRRPATESGRTDLVFSETSPGRYSARAAPGSGAWDLKFAATGEWGQAFEGERRLSWP